VPIALTDDARGAQAVAPELGTRAVTAALPGDAMRNDPRTDPGPPTLPAPLKGLGIPPLNTRQVGDFDKLDDPEPPAAWREVALDPPAAAAVDLRR
jgi:hypothetical protein